MRSHPRGAESPARRRSPADQAAPGPALPRSLSVGDQIVAAAANRAGDCSTAIPVPGPARLHPPWVTDAVRTLKPGAPLQLQPGSVPSRHHHVLASSPLPKPLRGSPAGVPQPLLPSLTVWLCGRAPPPPQPVLLLPVPRRESNPACRVVQCTSIASSPYGRTCCILIYCLFG